jgi:hypothetical protein
MCAGLALEKRHLQSTATLCGVPLTLSRSYQEILYESMTIGNGIKEA